MAQVQISYLQREWEVYGCPHLRLRVLISGPWPLHGLTSLPAFHHVVERRGAAGIVGGRSRTRILLIGYVFGIRSERRLCSEIHLNLAYRWFCRLGLEGAVPDHSTFTKNRYGRFRESDIYRVLFENVVGQCCSAGLVSGEGFAVDGSLIGSNSGRTRRVESVDASN